MYLLLLFTTTVFAFSLNGQETVARFPEKGIVFGTLTSSDSISSRFELGSSVICSQTDSGIQELNCKLLQAGYQLVLTGNSSNVELTYQLIVDNDTDEADDDDDNEYQNIRDYLIVILTFTLVSCLCISCGCVCLFVVLIFVCSFGTTSESSNVYKDGRKITRSLNHWRVKKKKSKKTQENEDNNEEDQDVDGIDLEGIDLEKDGVGDNDDGDENDEEEDTMSGINLNGITDLAMPIATELIGTGVNTGVNAGVNAGVDAIRK